MTILTLRDSMLSRAPRWLRRGRAGAFLYVLGMMLDALLEMTVAAVRVRFPGFYSAQSLEVLGRDRRIRRGIYESDSSYATRLTRWLDDHELRGGPYQMFAQLHAFFAPNNFQIDLVYYSGRRFQMSPDGSVERDDIVWSPDGQTAKWARWWLFFRLATPLTSDGLWDDPGTWGDGGVWDSTLTVEEAANYRAVATDWNTAHAFGRVVLVSPSTALWDYPSGNWDEDDDTWESETPAEFDIV